MQDPSAHDPCAQDPCAQDPCAQDPCAQDPCAQDWPEPDRLHFGRPITAALRAALPGVREAAARGDLLFLERWEIAPQPGTALALRVQQIRRANPGLAAAIRAEVAARGGAASRG